MNIKTTEFLINVVNDEENFRNFVYRNLDQLISNFDPNDYYPIDNLQLYLEFGNPYVIKYDITTGKRINESADERTKKHRYRLWKDLINLLEAHEWKNITLS